SIPSEQCAGKAMGLSAGVSCSCASPWGPPCVWRVAARAWFSRNLLPACRGRTNMVERFCSRVGLSARIVHGTREILLFFSRCLERSACVPLVWSLLVERWRLTWLSGLRRLCRCLVNNLQAHLSRLLLQRLDLVLTQFRFVRFLRLPNLRPAVFQGKIHPSGQLVRRRRQRFGSPQVRFLPPQEGSQGPCAGMQPERRQAESGGGAIGARSCAAGREASCRLLDLGAQPQPTAE